MIHRNTLHLAGFLFSAALVVSGCNCKATQVQKSYGELQLVSSSEEGPQTPLGREAVYELGAVFMGQSKPQKIVIKNFGGGALGLEKVEYVSGDKAKIGEAVVGDAPAAPVFDVKFATRMDVGVSGTAEIDVIFSPPTNEDPTKQVVDHELVLYLRTSNEVTSEPAKVTLKGRGVSGVCDIANVLEFGSVAVGDTGAATITLRNPTLIEATASVGDVYSNLAADKAAFRFAPESPRGSITLAAKAERTVTLQFLPTEQRSYQAYLDVKASAQCPKVIVELKGKGVENVLTWAPSPLNFLYVTPGVKVTKTLTFKNEGNKDVQITGLTTRSAEYKVVPEPMMDPTSLLVPGRSEKSLVISFAPERLGNRNSQLVFATNLPKQNAGSVALWGFGGGPDIDVKPAPTLNFGKVAYFPGANSFQTRKLTVFNVGTAPATPDPAGNLRLGGANGAPPFFEVKHAAGTEDGTFEVTLPTNPAYDPALGLVAQVGKNLVALLVKATPKSLGTKEADVTIFSNDPDEPAVVIHVVADSVDLPPCQYQVTPSVVNFGVVTPPSYRDLGFTITNLGQNPTDECLLSGLDIGVGSADIFSLPNGPIAAQTLAPKQSLNIVVRAWPQKLDAAPSKTGTVEFFMSSNTKPQGVVSLQANVGTSCVTILPEDINFGTVQRGCNSATKNVTIYNTCSQNGGSDVVLNSIVMQAAAGQAAGGPECPGTAACPEFTTFNPGIPAGGLVIPKPGASGIASSFTFSNKYKPIDFGTDTGAVAVNLTLNNQNLTYVVSLSGKGDTVGENTDIFRQDSKPKADILLVIDSSGSMGDEQMSLSANFASFIKYADSRGIDYHIAVVTTDMDDPLHRGKFVSAPTHPEKVLTPTTSDVANKFKLKVNVGTLGSGTEMEFAPALAALTAPLIVAENVDFLRDDANLAIVAVTDEPEQSPQAPTFYYNAFLNIKGFKRANMFSWNAIYTLPPCAFATVDTRMDNMVTLTNGVKDSICTPDWAKALEQLGKTAFGYRTNFFLNSVPDLTGGKQIEVRVNGVLLPKTDPRGATVWTYDSVGNSVNFEPMFVPEPGQTLTLTYRVVCVP